MRAEHPLCLCVAPGSDPDAIYFGFTDGVPSPIENKFAMERRQACPGADQPKNAEPIYMQIRLTIGGFIIPPGQPNDLRFPG